MAEPTRLVVYVVHCVDTEGPLYESLDATFDRLESIFGIRLAATVHNLQKLQSREIPLGGKEDVVASAVRSELLHYNRDWSELNAMLKEIMSADYRKRFPDSRGRGWVFNWHCVDHVGYEHNPRRRAIGYHAIFDHYNTLLQQTGAAEWDEINWHFHPMSVYREAHRCATSYGNSPHLYEILCRRVIERKWFPCVNRAGFHAERPDSHWFLEQWIPFDLSNQAVEEDDTAEHADARAGRFGDWRRAPAHWCVYHPSHDDYQVPGACRRVIGRCLNVDTRFRNLTEAECDKAFRRAQAGEPTLLGVCSHDFRDIRLDVERVYALLTRSMKRHPDVEVVHSRATDAFRAVLGWDPTSHQPLLLGAEVQQHETGRRVLTVRTARGMVFGPQPFLAIEMRGGRFVHDNLDWTLEPGTWTYTFDADSVHPHDVRRLAVVANDTMGFQSLCQIDF